MSLQKLFRLLGLVVIASAICTPAVHADEAVVSITVYPPEIHLNTATDRQGFLVVATRADGVQYDVTETATVTLANDQLVRREGNTILPVADGQTTLQAAYEGHTVDIPITVIDAVSERPISFTHDVMPVMMRSGCNTGACHGAARGKDGFHLSLFSSFPAADHHRITRELGARRINLALPEESLILTKGAGLVTHTGGKRFDVGDIYYQSMLKWIQAGAPNDSDNELAVVSVELFPPRAVLQGENVVQRFLVLAHYSDGSDRDVTDLAVFLSNNETAASIDVEGVVTSHDRGEAFVTARFDIHTVGSQIIVLPAELEYTPPEVTGNYIDELVGAKLQDLRILPSGVCSDEEFIRRVTIDITGLLPTVEDLNAFLADASPDKRAALIDSLLERKEFSEIWAMKWAELLMIRSGNQTISYKAAFLYYSWINEQIANDVPLDQMVRDLITASGGTFAVPETNFYQIERDTLKTAENVAQVFMGLRTQCAQCHNHPFDRWTMDDYYGFAAFFSQIGRKDSEDFREKIIFNRGGGEVRHIVDNRVVSPQYLGGEMPDIPRGTDRREILAQWLTSPENTFFANNFANRIWAHFMGIGIIEPVDDVRISNPASNPELLDELGRRLVQYNYDFKQMVRDICNSQAYQRSTTNNQSNAHDELNFARSLIRRIPAESMLDCITLATDTQDKFRGLPVGARAVQIADGTTSNYFLTTFGRARRETVCSCEPLTEPTLSQALHLLNGDTIQNKIRQGGLIASRLEAGNTPEQIVDLIFLR